MIKLLSLVMLIFLNALKWILYFILFLTIFSIIKPYISHVESYQYLHYASIWGSSLDNTVKEYFPTVFFGYHLSHLITLVGTLFLISLTGNLSSKLKFSYQRHGMVNELIHMQNMYKSADQKDKLDSFKKKLEKFTPSPGKSRHDLLMEFSSIKKELEKMGRDLAFLSIDVVDSTNMKKNEDQSTIEVDFIEYRNYVESKFKNHGLIKATWTPDGVMACFNTVEDAVQSAQDVLNGLKYFNRDVKGMKKDFVVRCGINAGRVYYDESVPLENVSDRVIDIAGHMQKHCPPNSILISKQIIEPVQTRDNFKNTQQVVDGLPVSEWKNNEKE